MAVLRVMADRVPVAVIGRVPVLAVVSVRVPVGVRVAGVMSVRVPVTVRVTRVAGASARSAASSGTASS